MYQDLIRAELTEAAEVLNRFLSDDKTLLILKRPQNYWLSLLSKAVKFYRAVMVALTVMQCILRKS